MGFMDSLQDFEVVKKMKNHTCVSPTCVYFYVPKKKKMCMNTFALQVH